MGGEGAFVHAEANAISHAIGSSHAESGYSLLDDYESSYIDPAEHDRVDSQEILKSLLLSDDNIGKTAPHDMLFTPFWTVKNIAIELTRILNPNRNSASLKTLSDFWTSEWSL